MPIAWGRGYKAESHELVLKRMQGKEIAEIAEARELAKKLEASTVKLEIKAGEGGRTFGSISTKEIALALKEQSDLEIDRKKIQLSEPIKNAGSYTVAVKLHPKVTVDLKVVVDAV